MSLQKVLSIILYILMGVSAVFVGIFYFGGVVEGTEGTPLEEPVITETILKWAYGLIITAAVGAIIFPLGYMIVNPRNAVKALISLGIIAVVILVASLFASDAPLMTETFKFTDTTVLKQVGTGIYTTYLLLGIAILSILYSEIAKFFK
jgi:putative copper export protein